MRRLALLLPLLAAPAAAQTYSWCLHATGAEVVPPVTTPAVVRGLITLDVATSELSWILVPTELQGTQFASHFHGPAMVGKKAGIQILLGTGEVIESRQALSPQQVADLLAGLWYMNTHTSFAMAGEVRGQLDDACRFDVLCKGAPNGARPEGARLVTGGDLDVGANALTFAAAGLPPNEPGFLLVGAGTDLVTPPGAAGQLCLAGAPVARFDQLLVADAAGVMAPFTPDVSALPGPLHGAVQAGDTWGFQVWFRDQGGAGNFTDAVALTFQ